MKNEEILNIVNPQIEELQIQIKQIKNNLKKLKEDLSVKIRIRNIASGEKGIKPKKIKKVVV